MATTYSQSIRKKRKQQQAKISKYFLITVLVGLTIVGLYNLWKNYAPQNIITQYVPYGLDANTEIKIGDEAEPQGGISKLNLSSKEDWNRALFLERNGKYSEALELFELITSLNPNFESGIYHTTFCRLQAPKIDDKKEDAINSGIKLLKSLLSRHSSVLFLEAVMGFRQGHFVESMEILEEVIEKSPQYAKAYAYLAEVQLLNNLSAKAISNFKTAISLWGAPKAQSYSGLALAYSNMGMLDLSTELVDYTLENDSNNPRALRVKGYLNEFEGNYSEAEVLYKRILSNNPEDEDAIEALKTIGQKKIPSTSGVAMQNRTSPQAMMNSMLEILTPLVEEYPENIPLKYALAMSYYRGRNFTIAKKNLEEILELDSSYYRASTMIEEINNTENIAYLSENNSLDLFDSIKKLLPKKSEMSSFERLGHYLVPWNSSEVEFLEKYDISRFKRLKDKNLREVFYAEETFYHQYTAMFDSTGYFGVHVLVRDTSYASKSDILFDLYGKFLKKNSHISGIGSSTGEAECTPKDSVFQAVIWETPDNFEMLLQFAKRKDEVRMIRLARTHVPKSLRLCDYVPFVKLYSN